MRAFFQKPFSPCAKVITVALESPSFRHSLFPSTLESNEYILIQHLQVLVCSPRVLCSANKQLMPLLYDLILPILLPHRIRGGALQMREIFLPAFNKFIRLYMLVSGGGVGRSIGYNNDDSTFDVSYGALQPYS